MQCEPWLTRHDFLPNVQHMNTYLFPYHVLKIRLFQNAAYIATHPQLKNVLYAHKEYCYSLVFYQVFSLVSQFFDGRKVEIYWV